MQAASTRVFYLSGPVSYEVTPLETADLQDPETPVPSSPGNLLNFEHPPQTEDVVRVVALAAAARGRRSS